MQRFRVLATKTAPGWVLLWLVASLNLLTLCCVDDVLAGETRVADHGHHADRLAHSHLDTSPGHSCTVSLTKPGIPLLPAASAFSTGDDVSPPLFPGAWSEPQQRAFRSVPLPVHGPPANHRLTYLHTLRLRL